MEIDFIQELKKRDELLDGYLRQIEIQEEFIQKQKELIEYLEDHISKITDIVSSVQQDCTGGKRMPDTYDHITLMCRLKAAQRRNKELESGEKYIQLEELHQKEYNVYEHKIEKLKKELADAHKETIRVRNYWLQVLEDMLREFEKAQKRSAQELRKMEIRALNAEKQRDDALDKAAVFRHQFYEAASRLEEEQGKNLKLRAQINRDYENSSIPSSKAVRRKKITNNREKTGRKPGGQPGHKGHCRKRQEPTQPVILLPPPEEVLEDCAFKKTARTIVKQMVSIRMVLNVTEYHADVYYNSHTGDDPMSRKSTN